MNFDTTTINYDQYYQIWKARKKAGLKTANDYLPHTIDEHDTDTGNFDCSLVGSKIKNKSTRKVYVVEKVYIRYYFGWYVELLYERKKSHGMITWMSITDFSKEQYMSNECARRRSEFVLVEGVDLTREEVVDYINTYCPQKIK
jgi:hypothetical protein